MTIAALGYRSLALALAPLLLRDTLDGAQLLVLLGLCGTLLAVHLNGIRRRMRGEARSRLATTALGSADLVLAGGFVVASGFVFEGHTDALSPILNPAWIYAQGTVLLAAAHGLMPGIVAAIGGAGLAPIVRHIAVGESPLRELIVPDITLLVALAIGVGTNWLSHEGARQAAREGIRAGREAERARHLRAMHDTVLQTLEAVASLLERDDAAQEKTLGEVRRAVRTQATELRTELRRADEDLGEIQDELQRLLTEFETRSEIVTEFNRVGDIPTVDPARVDALLGAFGEILRNVERHSEARRLTALLRAEESGIRLIVRDEGKGFDPLKVRAEAFGIRESVVARLEEAGGGARIESSLGSGTRCEMWIPA